MTANVDSKFIAAATPAPPERPIHILIIGAGICGVSLAQGLHKSGVSVAVYERDRTPVDLAAYAPQNAETRPCRRSHRSVTVIPASSHARISLPS
jgi:glycine/D-amino acid oxidase-like deaminating enzyme